MITAAHFALILRGLASDVGFLAECCGLGLITQEAANDQLRASVDLMLQHEMSEDERAQLGAIRAGVS